ncbi:hypothetical protein EHI8A_044590 [Entamoeba histolytica HM-1:IMSS-B]|uniref:EamA domain-containing protein n=6 Tax=Entamoeba histolytica TaxID=5759 RepID=C4LST4_ENTH1|nr:hypothetical protein, conserved [Entamoeba histolytica HM-1:IMSS]EMD49277.1 Hypothetical protein EHI5A_000800 [Entamoeba histolytica KU27]EMH77704.1 hypothetical protein EHI8A_044590 [Entamoeba histolytica HM-1:IMSS-B]EMS10815.1 hypothetical protein KM1_002090 [Entamoeba histolytica HM-3:IMSS]ENY61909.1 hypothetical protein EHI7A_018630 [Entamoeba histolytica HM-1:IMSS-A]GAT91500.1 hypothetical protein conserved [Entamoeba histolytica]|eukprot:XP_656964.1 hypothetical protein, conserved [Entamoeba histolytica HM-1:IMSS]
MKLISYIQQYKGLLLLIFFVCLFLIMGTGSTIISKTTYAAESKNKEGNFELFERPMFFNFLMFFGMFLALIIYYFTELIKFCINCYKKRNKQIFSDNEEQSLAPNETNNEPPKTFGEIEEEQQPKRLTFKQYLFVFLPSICDFLGTYMMNFGLLYIPSSVYQMMRGSTIIFAMLLAIFWRKQKQYVFHFTGVGLIIIALILVGCSMFIPNGSSQNDDSSNSNDNKEHSEWYYILIGISLIILAQFLHALQTILEEILLHDIKAPVTFIVGLRGFYGCLCCIIVLTLYYFMPFLPASIRENIVDTFYMIYNSSLILSLCIAYIIVILFFNFAGTAVIRYSNAMIRNILEPMRMISVWIVSVFIHYVISSSYGESVGWSTIVQVIGFILLVIGFLLYTKVIKIPCLFNYHEQQESLFVELQNEPKQEDSLQVPQPLEHTEELTQEIPREMSTEKEEMTEELTQQNQVITDD